ncbi:MAG: DUF4115 domain-containing protein [Pseudomonadota bacterium]|nr:DUF4115 domain-containing protein [Pseudomonadota bacterium]
MLFESTLKTGDHYDVPADAKGPMINVGRPDQLQITVNGSAVPPLGDGGHALKDVGISVAALTARTVKPSLVAAPAVTPIATPPTPVASPVRISRRPVASPARGAAAGIPAAAPLNIAAPPVVPAPTTGNTAP